MTRAAKQEGQQLSRRDMRRGTAWVAVLARAGVGSLRCAMRAGRRCARSQYQGVLKCSTGAKNKQNATQQLSMPLPRHPPL